MEVIKSNLTKSVVKCNGQREKGTLEMVCKRSGNFHFRRGFLAERIKNRDGFKVDGESIDNSLGKNSDGSNNSRFENILSGGGGGGKKKKKVKFKKGFERTQMGMEVGSNVGSLWDAGDTDL